MNSTLGSNPTFPSPVKHTETPSNSPGADSPGSQLGAPGKPWEAPAVENLYSPFSPYRSSVSLWILISTFFTSLSAFFFFNFTASHAPTFLSLSETWKKLPTAWEANQEFVVTSWAGGKWKIQLKQREKFGYLLFYFWGWINFFTIY